MADDKRTLLDNIHLAEPGVEVYTLADVSMVNAHHALDSRWGWRTVPTATTGRITKVTRYSVFFEMDIPNDNGKPVTRLKIASGSESLGDIAIFEGSFRRLGEVPEGAISPDDPRIEWLWNDAARLAERMNHCSEYDRMCDLLGIPGRERKIGVALDVDGIKVKADVIARSKGEAERKLRETLLVNLGGER